MVSKRGRLLRPAGGSPWITRTPGPRTATENDRPALPDVSAWLPSTRVAVSGGAPREKRMEAVQWLLRGRLPTPIGGAHPWHSSCHTRALLLSSCGERTIHITSYVIAKLSPSVERINSHLTVIRTACCRRPTWSAGPSPWRVEAHFSQSSLDLESALHYPSA